MIKQTTEFVRYRRPFHDDARIAVKYVRREPAERFDADRAEISDQALGRYLESRRSPLVKAGSRLSNEIGNLIETEEARADTMRTARVRELHLLIQNGSYDFNGEEAIADAAKTLLQFT